MVTLDQRLAETEQRLKQLKAKQQQIEARKRAANTKKQRTEDTRRKVLVGAAFLDQVQHGKVAEPILLKLMDQFLVRTQDRALFGLPVHAQAQE
ncbi:hypothetical protein BBJ41_00165 [Burkholderia stabilis]|uniref:hypothetical protein n=1 Tax=Burkholderia stabilis TaxID=95485 RepID=UPI000851D26E|nr:hypothetical protein [Burkholderia stabilis]AOR66085.1 hypothetical protein BBJ41_00165 [Burkholderia stabilis]HDR9496166.1 mobilization protein [Burkholderia stabilis]HDR9527655.1 mobilization protein [Burkholderia stabilis]HDR9534537.1 mobilization protein [Burkholderia stabilis]HDR9542738.1 mobilization protein [Burkholderia stabilis]